MWDFDGVLQYVPHGTCFRGRTTPTHSRLEVESEVSGTSWGRGSLSPW